MAHYGGPPQGPPPGQYQQQNYGHAPPPGAGGFPPQQQGNWGPPQGHQQPYGGHPQGGFGGPPQGPPPGQHGGGFPPSQHGPPTGQYQQHPQQQQQFGHPQQQQHHGGPPSRPSPGYDPRQMPQMDMSNSADGLRKAMKGFGTDEKLLIQILAPMGPLEVNGVKAAFNQRHKRDLMKDIHGETSSYFRDGLKAIVRGPLEQDCELIRDALKGIGTKESILDEVLLSRSNADINAIKAHYQYMFDRSLQKDMQSDLSGRTERMYDMVLAARREEDSNQVIPQQIDGDVQELYKATEGQMGTDELQVCSILTTRNNNQIRAISQAYQRRFQRPLSQTIKKEFSGHMQDALMYIVARAEDPAKHDADNIEAAMKGFGTKDEMLVRRVVAVHWDRDRLQQCKAAYKHFYGKTLASRIGGDTSGDYGKLMVALVGEN